MVVRVRAEPSRCHTSISRTPLAEHLDALDSAMPQLPFSSLQANGKRKNEGRASFIGARLLLSLNAAKRARGATGVAQECRRGTRNFLSVIA